jgi:hypothetical protein
MDRVPVRIHRRQRPPLTARRSDREDRVHDCAPIHRRRATHLTPPPHRLNKIGDQIPLCIRHIAMRSATLKLSVESVPSRISTVELRHPTRSSQHHGQHKLSEHTLSAGDLILRPPARMCEEQAGRGVQFSARQQTSSSIPAGSRKNSDHSFPSRWISPTSCAPAASIRVLTASRSASDATASAK